MKLVSLLLLLLSHTVFGTESFNCRDFNYDPANIYPICEDGNQLLSEVESKSKREGKQSILIFGYSSCPWSRSLHQIFNGERKEEFKRVCSGLDNFNIQELPVGFYFKTLAGEYLFKSIAGKDIIDQMAKEQGVHIDGYPMIAVSNPISGKKQIIDTGDLEDNTNGKGHSLILLCHALKNAANANK